MWEVEDCMIGKCEGVQLTFMVMAGARLKQDMGTPGHSNLT